MQKKILILLEGNDVAPRFDLCSEVWIGELDEHFRVTNEQILVLPNVSSEEMCQLILTQSVDTVICNAIENEYYQYLVWKNIEVYDSVIGEYKQALQAYTSGVLSSERILTNLQEECLLDE